MNTIQLTGTIVNFYSCTHDKLEHTGRTDEFDPNNIVAMVGAIFASCKFIDIPILHQQ